MYSHLVGKTLNIHTGIRPTLDTLVSSHKVKGVKEARVVSKIHNAKPWNF